MRRVLLTVLSVLGVAACNDASSQAPPAPNAAGLGPPLQTGRANASFLKPAFASQTRAPSIRTSVPIRAQVILSDLDKPWSLAFLPDGRMLITEKGGTLNLVSADGKSRRAIPGLPPVDPHGQGGLLDVALAPDYATSGLIYWCYSEPGPNGTNGTAAARGRLMLNGEPRIEDVKVLFSQNPKLDSDKHYGCRFAFAGDGTFFLTTGERSILEGRRQAQRLDGDLGKVIRLNLDGSVPADNPFAKGGGRPEIWSYGHRNMQGAAMRPGTHDLWTSEHGARGGDEVNKDERGKDYGWPTITYGIEYAGGKIGAGIGQHAGMEQPVYYWDPVIAPSGMAFYTGDLVPEWKGNVFIGGLKTQNLVRLVLDGDRVKAEEQLLGDLGKRIRDVRNGPDGALWLLTDEGDLIRVAPE
jgi:glucose/arabinose dehydrogenase